VAHSCNLATQGAEIRRIEVRRQPGQIHSQDPISKKLITKKGLVEWLKVKVLSLSSSTKNKKVDFKVECGGIRL
jgi:hypothetical protein